MKILSRLKHPVGDVLNEDTHVMIGNDSDLLVMALLSEAAHVHVLGQVLDHLVVSDIDVYVIYFSHLKKHIRTHVYAALSNKYKMVVLFGKAIAASDTPHVVCCLLK